MKTGKRYTAAAQGFDRTVKFTEVDALELVKKNATILTPCWPRAGPTGGAGVALPAGICNLMYPSTFFAI